MAMESEIEVLKSVVHKLDTSLERISEVSNNIGRLLAVHDERLSQLEKASDNRDRDIKELNFRLATQTSEILEKIENLEKIIERKMKEDAESTKRQHKEIQIEIRSDVEKLETRLNIIERWRWYVIGAVAAIGYIVGNTGILNSLK